MTDSLNQEEEKIGHGSWLFLELHVNSPLTYCPFPCRSKMFFRSWVCSSSCLLCPEEGSQSVPSCFCSLPGLLPLWATRQPYLDCCMNRCITVLDTGECNWHQDEGAGRFCLVRLCYLSSPQPLQMTLIQKTYLST